MISLDYSVFFQIINFLVLILFLNALLYKPAQKTLEGREKRLRDAELERERLDGELVRKRRDYEERLSGATRDALLEKDRLIGEATEEGKKILDQANREIPLMMSDFQEKIAGETKEAMALLEKKTEAMALEIAGKALGRSLK